MNQHLEIKKKLRDMMSIMMRDQREPDRFNAGIEAFNLMAFNGVFDAVRQGDNKDRFCTIEVRPVRDVPPFDVVLIDEFGITIDRKKL